MMTQSPKSWEASRPSDLGLSSLERLGAFFTSQIHDLNNQMAVLSNSELLLPDARSISPEMQDFVQGLFGAIHRLSATCDQFNAIRKIYPLEVEKISLREAVEVIAGAVGDCKGWHAWGKITGDLQVFLNASWLPVIITQLAAHMQTEKGIVQVSIGELPPRQYKYALRSAYTQGPNRALLLHFKGESPAIATEAIDKNAFLIAIELIRLQGAAISLNRSDSTQDYLLAFRLQP